MGAFDRLRVRHKETGHELEVSQSMYDFAPDAYELLDASQESAESTAAKPGRQAVKEGTD